jgi:myo-inositol-1(or 4)-monophosphatase
VFHQATSPESKIRIRPSTKFTSQALFRSGWDFGEDRVNLSWGSNTIIQVAAGYADVAIEFARGFATYDILPGLYIGLKTGLTILDLHGNPITWHLNLDEIFAASRIDAKHPKRTPLVAAMNPALAEQVIRLLKKA